MVNQLEVTKATVRALRERREEELAAARHAPKGVERPADPPLGGHRGALYCGDLYQILRRAAYRVDLRPIFNSRSKAWNKPHLWTLYAGDPDPSLGLLGQGPLMNITRGMVPEWTLTENANDPDSEIYCWGWRLVVVRCLKQRIIRPTREVVELLGESNYWRYMAQRASTV